MLMLLLLLLLLAAAAAAADRFRIGRRACTAQDRTGSSLPWAETLTPRHLYIQGQCSNRQGTIVDGFAGSIEVTFVVTT